MLPLLKSISVLVLFGFALLGAAALEPRLRRANELIQEGSYERAQAELQVLLREAEEMGPAAVLLGTLNNLAAIEMEMERYSQAERLYLRAGRVWEQLSPAERAEADPRFDLLALCVQAGWLKKAEQVAEGLSPAADRQQQIRYLDGLGKLRCAQKRFTESVEFHRRALQLAALNDDAGTAATLWNSIGVAFAGERKWNESVDAFERALEHNERVWGGQHPVLIATLTNLGAICLEQNRWAKAAAALGRARELAEKTLGRSYPGLYRILVLQAKAFERGKQPAEAKAARREAEAIRGSYGDGQTIDIKDLFRR